MAFNRSRSDGCQCQLSHHTQQVCRSCGNAHLISYPSTPFDHLWDCILVHALARFADGIDNGEVGLQRVQCLHSGLQLVSFTSLPVLIACLSNIVISCHGYHLILASEEIHHYTRPMDNLRYARLPHQEAELSTIFQIIVRKEPRKMI